jgi:diguanylate cyclase (GGDEF)-like protein
MLPFGSLLALPPQARLWWLLTVVSGLAVLPWCLSVEQPSPPAYVPLLVAVFNALLVVVTAYRRRRANLAPTFDYGGVATVTVLVLAGPAAALVSYASETLAQALLRNPSGQRPALMRSLFNLAWGAPAAGAAWAVCLLLPEQSVWDAAAAGAMWWLVNGLLVGPMVALSQRRTWLYGVRLALTNDGSLRIQEAVLVLFAVLAWRAHPLLLCGVFLLVISQAMMGQRLFREFETAALAREEAATERRRAETEATRARLDPLTGLPNRHALADLMAVPPLRAGVLMIDLDHFKQVNDRYGHAAGDMVLVAVAQAIRDTLRPADFCARMGGEEFLAVLPGIADEQELAAIAERVRLAVRAVQLADYPRLQATASVGATHVPPGMPLADGLLLADQATYRAKAAGRDCVKVHRVADQSVQPAA